MDQEDKIVLIKIKSLLNDMRYMIKEEDLKVVDEYHTLCRKLASDFEGD